MPQITVTFDLEITSPGEKPTGEDVAAFLTSAMREADERTPYPYSLKDPTVFMEPVAVVVDISGGLFHAAFAEIPTEVIAYDTEDNMNLRRVIPDPMPGALQGKEVEVWAGMEEAMVEPEAVAKVAAAMRDPAKALSADEDEAILPDGSRCEWDERLRTVDAVKVPRSE